MQQREQYQARNENTKFWNFKCLSNKRTVRNQYLIKMDTDRLQTNIDGIETRVEVLREQAFSIQKERESLLELLQNLQDNTDLTRLQDGEIVIGFRGH